MEAKILLTLPHDFNYKLSIRLAQLRRGGVKRTKADDY